MLTRNLDPTYLVLLSWVGNRRRRAGEEERKGKRRWRGGIFQIDFYLLNGGVANRNTGPEADGIALTRQHSFPRAEVSLLKSSSSL